MDRWLWLSAAGWSLLLVVDLRAVAAGESQRPARAERKARSKAPRDGDSGETMKFRVTRRPGQQQAPAAGDARFVNDPRDAVWTLKVGDGGQIFIAHDGVEVMKSGYAFGEQGKTTAQGQFKVVERSVRSVLFSGAVDALGLQWKGRAEPRSSHELRVELDVIASKPLTGIAGGGLTWIFNLGASALRDQAGAPVLLPDRIGWRWPVGQGQEIAVRFDRPVARLAFSEHGKSEIHTSFVGDRIRAGRGKIAMSVTLPAGARLVVSDRERYARPDRSWFRDALHWDGSPVDLSFLNADDRPAGRHGVVKADGDRLFFADGTPARFWGANLAGPVLFNTPRENIPRQARRMARLGYNLMRIHQQDSNWVNPNIFGKDARDTRRLDPQSLDALDVWIKCLKDEGIYVWLDLHYLREFKTGDGLTLGWDEIARAKGLVFGFNYLNAEILDLMKEFNHQYLSHVNKYTNLAYKDDPAVIGVLLTNENDLATHFGVNFLGDKNNPTHKRLYDREMADFAKRTGLPADRIWRSWEPGPAKYLLSELEHRFNRAMIDDLRSLGFNACIAPTSVWGATALFALPSLTDGDVIDAHAYGDSEALSANPHDAANFLSAAAAAQVLGKPLTITEWNVPFPEIDRFTSPLYVAGIASLQGWDAPMLYNYSQVGLADPGADEWRSRIDKWSTFYDPAITGVMPAAALAFRRGHISPARKRYCLMLTPDQLFGAMHTPENTPALRTLVEQSQLTIGMPAVKELPWLRPREPSGDAIVVTDPRRDFLPAGSGEVRSDTGELRRDWRQGIQIIDTPRTQAVSGWIGGKTLELKDATFRFETRKAVVALTSVDDRPIADSRFVLITAVAQAHPATAIDRESDGPGQASERLPFLSEPVVGTIRLRNPASGFELLALGPEGKIADRISPGRERDALEIRLPAGRGTHWYVLRTRQLPKSPDARPVPAGP